MTFFLYCAAEVVLYHSHHNYERPDAVTNVILPFFFSSFYMELFKASKGLVSK